MSITTPTEKVGRIARFRRRSSRDRFPEHIRPDGSRDVELPLREHLIELRNRLIKAALAVAITTGLSLTFAGTSRKPIGKNGLSIWLDNVASSPLRAPSNARMRTWLRGLYAGTKKGNPWMWSQWVCEMSRWAVPRPWPYSAFIISLPRRRIPVPASMMILGADHVEQMLLRLGKVLRCLVDLDSRQLAEVADDERRDTLVVLVFDLDVIVGGRILRKSHCGYQRDYGSCDQSLH